MKKYRTPLRYERNGVYAREMALASMMSAQTPELGQLLADPEQSGFRALNLHYNVVTKTYDASTICTVAGKMFVCTARGEWFGAALALLETGLLHVTRFGLPADVDVSSDVELLFELLDPSTKNYDGLPF